MHLIDWAIVFAYIAWLVSDGVKRTKLERTTPKTEGAGTLLVAGLRTPGDVI